MGACVSRSPASAEGMEELRRAAAVDTTTTAPAMVMDMDGAMARLEAPVTARAALGGDAYSCFVCCADELAIDAPPRAMDAGEALRPGQLYFVLPLPALRRPVSGRDMAALAVKASAAMAGFGAGLSETASATPARRRKDDGGDGEVEAGKRRRRRACRVTPLVVVGGGVDAWTATAAKAKTAKGGRRRGSVQVQRLSAIPEGSE
uniref:Uncharacterized protein n=1 Tax=Leersia perrieri TaxID=77586 RepID=A0A0D9XF64_9ORYZ